MFEQNTNANNTLPKQPLIHQLSSQKKLFKSVNNASSEERQIRKSALRSMSFTQTINYKTIRAINFQQQIESTTNIYTLLKCLFEISNQIQWRTYLTHIGIILKKLHDLIIESEAQILKDINIYENFQINMQRLLYLNDKQLFIRLFQLFKLLLVYNRKYNIFDEDKLSKHFLNCNRIDGMLTQSLYLLTQLQAVSEESICKILKIISQEENTLSHQLLLLPSLTILVNYIATASCERTLELGNNNLCQQAISLGIQSSNFETSREALLLVNRLLRKDTRLWILVNSWGIQNMSVILNNPEKEQFIALITDPSSQ